MTQLGKMFNDINFVILCMVFMHIINDFALQGILASMKQKKWWRESKDYKDKYDYDYIEALACHGFSWSFMTFLPLAIMFTYNKYWIPIMIVNAIIHAIIDDLKANRFKINLAQDQMLHILQIIFSTAVYVYIATLQNLT